jgi:hypothetical protein
MKKLIGSLVLGGLILLVLSALMSISLVAYVQRNYSIKLPTETAILVLGNSHPECAIMDDSILGLKNFSRSAEPLFYTNEKLKWLLKWNPQIRKVFVELSENQLESRMYDWIWSAESVQRHVTSLFPFLEWSYHLEAFKIHHLRYIESFFLGMKRTITAIFLEEDKCFFSFLQWGGFKSQKGSHINKSQDSVDVISKRQESLNPDKDNLDAVYFIHDICAKKEIELAFIRCPYHHSAPKNFETAYRVFFANHPDFKLLDFRDFNLPDSCFYDSQHLNDKGASIFSAYFKGIIDKKRPIQ